jgi:hypothetical protein
MKERYSSEQAVCSENVPSPHPGFPNFPNPVFGLPGAIQGAKTRFCPDCRPSIRNQSSHDS